MKSPLSDMSFANTFFPICALSFNSLDIAFDRAEVFSSNEVQFIHYFFHGLCLWCCIWKSLHTWGRRHFLLSSWVFLVLYFAFRSVTHFELIFVKSARSGLDSVFCICNSYLPQRRLVKRLPLLHWVTFAPLTTISWLCLRVSLSGFCLFHWSICPCSPTPHCPDYCGFPVSLHVGWHHSSSFVVQYCVGFPRIWKEAFFFLTLCLKTRVS